MANATSSFATDDGQAGGSRTLRVFLCHASSDKPAVRSLYQRLRADGVQAWLDEEDLLPGQDWEFAIRQEVRAADVVIVCLSQAAVTSAGYRHKEISLALEVADQQPEGTISVIPLRLEECSIPDRLRHLQWVNLFDERGYERLIRTLRYRADEIKVLVAPAVDSPPPPPPQVPTPSPPSLENLWQNAQLAYYSKQWTQAETYLRQVLTIHANYKDAPAKLTEVTRQLQVQIRYQEIANLRATDAWEEVLTSLDDLAQEEPDFPDSLSLADWARGQQRRQQRFKTALTAFDASNWVAAETELVALLAEFPDDADARNLLARARAEQQSQVHPAHLIQSGQIAPALDQIEHMLTQYPHDPRAISMLGRLFESPHIPVDQRHRSALLLARAGDPRPGVCTLEPAWCDEIPDGAYPVAQATQVVRLNRFRIARYPVTVWQFRQFWEMGGYTAEGWWTPEGWAWKQQKKVSEPFRWTDPQWTLDNQPVIGASWYEAAAFCNWLTDRGQGAGWLAANERIRLPTEAEWAVAAGWDADGQRMLPWAPESLDWLNTDDHDPPFDQPTPVGLFPLGISPCGALDMAGNVWEWCTSSAADYPRGAGAVVADFAANQVITPVRGGSFKEPARRCGWSVRRVLAANSCADDVGFRVGWTDSGE